MSKRSLDLLVSSVCLLLALPVLVVCACVIKFGSRGPVLYRQVRMGRHFRPFVLYKLRTMIEREGPNFTVAGDPRITRAGQWMRRLKLDELPQLWNVLRGDMSLVGPRPVVPELVREFAVHYADLLSVRPGLTDPASIKYCCEADLLATVQNPKQYFKQVTHPDKLRISRRYMERANLATDLGVLALTALVLLLHVPAAWPVAPADPLPGACTPS